MSRAVEKLRGYFQVGSQTLPATVVTYYLYSKMAGLVPPVGLAAKIATAATTAKVAGAGATRRPERPSFRGTSLQHMAIIKTTWVATSIAGALVVLSVGTGVIVFKAIGNQTPQHVNTPAQTQNDFRIR